MHRYHQNLVTGTTGVTGRVVFKKRMTKIDEANRRYNPSSLEHHSIGEADLRKSLDSAGKQESRKPRRLYENRPSTAQPPSLSKNRHPKDLRIVHGQEVLSEGRDDLLMGLAKRQREEQFHCYIKY